MTIKLKSAPSNDNCSARWRFINMHELLRYIPVARRLIKQYCQHSWKHADTSNDYTFMEYQLCTLLKKDASKNVSALNIDIMARVLETKAIVLFNDPSLSML